MNALFFDTFNEYCSKYKKGIRKISQECHLLTIEKKSLNLEMEKKDYGTFELYFEANGRLTCSIHREKLDTYKVNYSYNRKGYLISAICSLTINCELHSISEFTYDSKGRIEIETVRHFLFYSNLIWTEQHIHTYNENREIINILGHDDEDDEYMIYNTYDINHNLIESSTYRNMEEFMDWHKNEYNINGELLKCITLDKEGKEEDVVEYYKFKDGLKSVYLAKSKESNSVSEYHYTTDEKGNWTNKVYINNGEPKYVYTREIKYF